MFLILFAIRTGGRQKKEKSIYGLLLLLGFITCLQATIWVTGGFSLTFGVAIGNSCLDIK